MTEDGVFKSCKRMVRRFTQSDAGKVGQQYEVGNSHGCQRREQPRRVRVLSWFPIFVSVFLRGVCASAQSPPNVKPTAQPEATASEHVGSLTCAACHKQIYTNYSKTGMG